MDVLLKNQPEGVELAVMEVSEQYITHMQLYFLILMSIFGLSCVSIRLGYFKFVNQLFIRSM